MKKIMLGFLFFCQIGLVYSQEKKSEIKWKWSNPAKQEIPLVHAQIWSQNDVKDYYDRLPGIAEGSVRKEVWNLSKYSTGLKLVFNTNAEEVIVRYGTSKRNYGLSHWPATGVSGVDLFAENSDGSWVWANGRYSFKDTVTYTYSSLQLDKEKYKTGRNFHLYLPLYNGVNWLEIGVPEGNEFRFIPVSLDKPIIVYGTSITQGGCASRPGMVWTNLLNRYLNTPVINLGFSGNGRLEKEVIDLIAAKKAKLFILECLPNMDGEVKNVREKIIYAVSTIRTKSSDTPIILADQPHYTEGRLSVTKTLGMANINKISYDTYKELQSQGIKNLFYIKHQDIGLEMDDTVDGTHPTDIGMIKHAKAYEKLIKTILK